MLGGCLEDLTGSQILVKLGTPHFSSYTFCMVVELGLSFYLWHPLQHFLWSRARARLGSLIRRGHCCNRPSLDPRPIKIRPGVYCMGDSAHALVMTLETGESPSLFGEAA